MVEMPTIGERVKITTSGPAGTTTHEGVVLPGAAPEHLTVKLANGYNVSHPISMVESVVSIADADQVLASISSVQQNQEFFLTPDSNRSAFFAIGTVMAL